MRSLYPILIGLSLPSAYHGILSVHRRQLTVPSGPHVPDAPFSPGTCNGIERANGNGPKDGLRASTALPTAVHSYPKSSKNFPTLSADAYTIGAEDVLEITVWRNQDLSKTVQVRPDGRFSLPVIRDVLAVGKDALSTR